MYDTTNLVLNSHEDYAIIQTGQDVWVGKAVNDTYEYVIGDWHVDSTGIAMAHDALDQLTNLNNNILTNDLS